MTVVAGIDEAGLGPVLGPLVVSASAFSVPGRLADVSLWRLLAEAVSRKPGRTNSRIAVGDSKKLFSRRRKEGLAHLERGVLAMLGTRGQVPRSLRELLDLLAPSARQRLGGYPWYAGGDVPLPQCVGEAGLDLSVRALAKAMTDAGVRLEAVRAEPVFAGEFNRLVRATHNKSTTAINIVGRLLLYLWNTVPSDDLRATVDRQGGRVRYLPLLELIFDGCGLKVLAETEALSAYRIAQGRRRAEVRFRVDAERHQFAVAFASMLSKYLRELFMGMFNRFWAGIVPDVAPTAGYFTDGRRFYSEIRPAVQQMRLDEELIYRSR